MTQAQAAGGVGGVPDSGPAIATGVKLPSTTPRQTDVMPARDTLIRLAFDKRLGHQRPLFVLAPAPPRPTCNPSNDPSLD